MNEGLLDAFRHNAWATKELLAACRGLPPEKLTVAVPGSFGGVLATLNHFVPSDRGYLRSLGGAPPAWVGEQLGLDELDARADETARCWERFLTEPFDAERVIILDAGAYEAHAGVILAQALYHATAHREQVCTILTSFGIEPPSLQAWEYGDATGRGRERNGEQRESRPTAP